jgi:RNA polymerase sigma-70 factor, ECF subfamily
VDPQHGSDDDRLIARCLEGDVSAFEPLVEQYRRPLYGVAVRLLGDREEARDAIQTAFLKAFESLDRCEPGRRFFSWIYRILVNECLNTRRDRRHTEPLGDLVSPRAAPDPVEIRETCLRVRQAVLRLPPDLRDVIVLRHFAELSYDEVGAALRIPAKTVKSRLFTARQRLVALLAAEAANFSPAPVYLPAGERKAGC